MTTSIRVNLTLAVDADGKVSAIYSAADPLTALYLDANGDLDFNKRSNHNALEGRVKIHFSLLTTQLTIAIGSRSKTEKTVKLHFDVKADQTIDIIPAKRGGKPVASSGHRRGMHVSPGPKGKIHSKPASFPSFNGTPRTLIVFDDNNDKKTYKYTLYVAIDAKDKSWLGFDPRIINQ